MHFLIKVQAVIKSKPICFLTPNNFNHKAGDGVITRKKNVAYIHPALQANPGATQATYILVRRNIK